MNDLPKLTSINKYNKKTTNLCLLNIPQKNCCTYPSQISYPIEKSRFVKISNLKNRQKKLTQIKQKLSCEPSSKYFILNPKLELKSQKTPHDQPICAYYKASTKTETKKQQDTTMCWYERLHKRKLNPTPNNLIIPVLKEQKHQKFQFITHVLPREKPKPEKQSQNLADMLVVFTENPKEKTKFC